ncbi:hypothetical protein AB1Y20_013643 [Prymnesium parvum]|uniref:PARG catalytic Macro domain-containing protein n=1 Tax=Prymnesium parvum TaxID=97485 RepID=A0AB34II11_PRYPA
MQKHRGEALSSRVAALRRSLAASPTWDLRYEAFELWCRHDVYGEPRPPTPPSRFFPKLRTLRDALLALEATMSAAQPQWSVWDDFLPALLRSLLRRTPRAPRLRGAGRASLRRGVVARLLCHALVLNVGRGEAVDLLGGGGDALYVSGARLALPKLLCVLAYLARGVEEDGEKGGEEAEGEGEEGEEGGEGGGEEEGEEMVHFVRARWEAAADGTAAPGGGEESEGGEAWGGVELAEGEPCDGAHRAVLISTVSGAPFGGGAAEGGAVSEEARALLVHPEALLGLWLFETPAAPEEVFIVRGARRLNLCRGEAHQLTYSGAADASPATLLFLDASRLPGGAQFAPPHVDAQLRKARAGLAALRAEGAAAAAAPPWGCGGYAGAQPLLRVLLLLLAAAAEGVRLCLHLPPPLRRWVGATLAELRARRPPRRALLALLHAAGGEGRERRAERFACDLPAFASYVIRSLREAEREAGGGGGESAAQGTGGEGSGKTDEGGEGGTEVEGRGGEDDAPAAGAKRARQS